MSPRDRHAKDQINVRLDPDLIGRLRDGAKRHDQTVTGIVTRGVTGELDRLDGIATSTAPAEPVSKPPAATFRPPRAHALTCKCGTCRPKEGKS